MIIYTHILFSSKCEVFFRPPPPRSSKLNRWSWTIVVVILILDAWRKCELYIISVFIVNRKTIFYLFPRLLFPPLILLVFRWRFEYDVWALSCGQRAINKAQDVLSAYWYRNNNNIIHNIIIVSSCKNKGECALLICIYISSFVTGPRMTSYRAYKTISDNIPNPGFSSMFHQLLFVSS